MSDKNRRVLLLDIDGTLCQMDKDLFVKKYVTDMSKSFTDLIPTEQFLPQIMKSTAFATAHPSSDQTWLEVFLPHFCQAFGLNPDGLEERFLDYYATGFLKFRSLITPFGAAKKLIKTARERGWRLGISSNCQMPQIGIRERIRWCELSPEDFEFIPGMESMHYCKPNPWFFQEIARKMAVDPQFCLVVGNDPEEDMVAFSLGMKTFFVGTELTQEQKKQVTYQGNLGDLIALLEKDEIF